MLKACTRVCRMHVSGWVKSVWVSVFECIVSYPSST